MDVSAQQITCRYNFKCPQEPEVLSQTLVHHYALPEQLEKLLEEHGFELENMYGSFDMKTFDEEESDHVIVTARRKHNT